MDEDYTHRIMPPTERARSGGWLLPAIILGTILWIAMAFTVFAQSSESTSVSGANSEVDVRTGAIAGSQINNYGQRAGEENRTYQEVATAPSLGGLALGGGHPCAYSPATAQISIIGGGAGIGGSKVDSACMLMVMGAAGDKKAYKAAQLMLAARDPAACRAMETAGLVVGCDADKRKAGSAAAAPKDFSAKGATAASSKSVSFGAKCEKNGKRITFRATSVAAQPAELAACKARFGV